MKTINKKPTVLYKAKFSGIVGEFWLVVELPKDHYKEDVNRFMYNRMTAMDKMLTQPQKTTKKFVKGVNGLGFEGQNYWRIKK